MNTPISELGLLQSLTTQGGVSQKPLREKLLQLLVEFASRARDENSPRDIALAILHALDNPCGLAALGAVSALGRIHYLLAVGSLGNLCRHGSPSISRHKSGVFVPNLS